MTRRRAALCALTLVSSLVLASGPALAPTAEAQAPPADPACARASEEAPVLVEVTTLAPRAPSRPDQPLQVSGRLVNCGSAPIGDLELRLGVGPRLVSRSEVERADQEPVVGPRRLTAEPAAVTLGPGASTPFDLRLLVRELRLGRANGVFPLTVQARGRVDGEASRLQLGLAHTFLPWFPDGPIAPTRLAWLVPLVDEPHRGPGDVLLDEELDRLLDDAPRGRLFRALLAGTTGATGACDPPAAPPAGTPSDPELPCRGDPVPMTYALDPDLLRDVDAMTRDHTVLRGGRRVTLPPSPAAEAWLVSLKQAVRSGSDVLALAYGDPDVVALTRPDSPVREDVEALRTLGAAVTEDLLEVEPLTSTALLPPGPVGSVVEALAGGEVETLVVDAAALPDPDPMGSRTQSARTVLATRSGDVTALVPDPGLADLLAPDPTGPGWQGTRLAEQRWIAEVAALTAERPSESRTFLVAPGRRADLVPAVVAAAVADSGRLPFLCAVSLKRAAAGDERCPQTPGGVVDTQGPARAEPRGTPVPRTAEDLELSALQVRDYARIRTASDQLTEQVLVSGSDPAVAAKARLLRARGRAASTAWRQEPARGRLFLKLLSDDVTRLRRSVRLIDVRPVLLTGSSGTIVLTVENTLDQPVTVGIGLPRNESVRLESTDTAVQVIPPRRAVDVSVRVAARTSGRFTAVATLLDAQGRPFGEQVELEVRSTQYGRVALAITGVAAAVLLVAAGVRITRRARHRRPAEDAGQAEGVGPAEDVGPLEDAGQVEDADQVEDAGHVEPAGRAAPAAPGSGV